MKKTLDIKKLILLNMPYILLGLFATNFGEAWRMAQGADASEKFLSLVAVLPGLGFLRFCFFCITAKQTLIFAGKDALRQCTGHGKGSGKALFFAQRLTDRREMGQDRFQLPIHLFCHPDAPVCHIDLAVVLLYDHAALHEQIHDTHHRGLGHAKLFGNAAGADIQMGL